MDRYSRRNLEDLVVPNYQETSDSYPSPDVWSGGWNMNTSDAAQKCFDYDVINNGFSGGLYSQMEMEIGKSDGEEAKRLKANGSFFNNSVSALHDFDGIQQMDDMFLSSILEDDVPGNEGVHSFKELDNNSPGTSSAYLDGRQVPLFEYDWDNCQALPRMVEEETPMNLREENMEEPSAEELVLQDLQRATEQMTDDTRKCFRDTFYRLAKNSQQKPESGNSNSEDYLEDQTRIQETELETNSIDRAIANLTFNKMESNMRNMPAPKRVPSIQG